jgi:hypothetical protein
MPQTELGMASNVVCSILEVVIDDYIKTDTFYNRLFNHKKIAEAKKELFNAYQMACSQLDLKYNSDLKELIDGIEEVL